MLAFLDSRGMFTRRVFLGSPATPALEIVCASPDALWVLVLDGSTRCVDRSPLSTMTWANATPPPAETAPAWLGESWGPEPPTDAINTRDAGWPGQTVRYAIDGAGIVYEWRPTDGGHCLLWLCGLPLCLFAAAPLLRPFLMNRGANRGSLTTR